jgi:hypothetical protein
MTQTTSDYQASALESMNETEIKRGLAAGELTVLEAELKESRLRRARIALDAIAGDEEALAQYERLEEREPELERRAEMCRLAMRAADEYIGGLRRSWLQRGCSGSVAND